MHLASDLRSDISLSSTCVCLQTVSGADSYFDSISSSAKILHIKFPLSVTDSSTRRTGPVRSASDFWVKKFLWRGSRIDVLPAQWRTVQREKSSLSLHALHVWPAAANSPFFRLSALKQLPVQHLLTCQLVGHQHGSSSVETHWAVDLMNTSVSNSLSFLPT